MTDDQRATPYLDGLAEYRRRGFTPFSTPGHKLGRGAPAELLETFGRLLLEVDIASAGGVEDTQASTGLLREAEALAAEAWGAERAFFLVNGSTGGIQSLMLSLAGPGDTVIIPRNSHKSVLAGLIFSGAMPRYVEPTMDSWWGVPHNLTVESVGEAIEACPHATACFVTSPTYNGFGADLAGIGAVVHAAGLPFIVDQAWGPHLRFCSRLPVDAMSVGADATVLSTHKLISGLTQSSVLLADSRRLNVRRLEGAVKMTQSTSPQALIYASIDGARMQMATEGEALWSRAVELAEWAREQIAAIPGFRCIGRECLGWPGVASLDPTRLTVGSRGLGLSGWQLERLLRDEHRIAPEAADLRSVILNVTFGDSEDDLELLVAALSDISERHRTADDDGVADWVDDAVRLPSFTRQELSPRDAYFASSTALPLADCVGGISAEIVTPYPPGIPVLGPGELISAEIVAYLAEIGARRQHVHGPEDPALKTLRVVS